MTLNQALPSQRRRTCHRHPTAAPTSGLCASCLRERLTSIEAKYSHSVRKNHGPAGIEEPRQRPGEVRSRGDALEDVVEANLEPEAGIPGESVIAVTCPHVREEAYDLGDETSGFDNGRRRSLVIEDFEEGEHRTMKEFIDLEWGKQSRKNVTWGDVRGIASAFGKKLMQWKQKRINKKKNEHSEARSVVTENINMILEEIHPPRNESGLGRRSCDAGAGLSVETGRVSIDEPRASWDGCLLGKSSQRRIPRALASPSEGTKLVSGSDAGEEKNPGGSTQTRDYYSDTRRRRSFDRQLLEDDVVTSVSNLKAPPETTGLFPGARVLVTEDELRGSNWYSIKPETVVDRVSKGADYVADDVNTQGFAIKRSSRLNNNVWNVWGLMSRKSETKIEADAKRSLKLERKLIEGSLARSLLKIRRKGSRTASEKLIRSYSISSRNSCDGPYVGCETSPWSSVFQLVNGVGAPKRSSDGFAQVFDGVERGRRSCDAVYCRANDAVGNMNSPNCLFRGSNPSNHRGLLLCSNGSAGRGRYHEGLRNRGNLVEDDRRSCDGLLAGLNGAEGARRRVDEGLLHALNVLEGGRKSCDGLFFGAHGVESKEIGMHRNEAAMLRHKLAPSTHINEALIRFYATPTRSYKRSRHRHPNSVVANVK